MAQWATFVGITGVVLVLLLVLSHLTQSSFSDADLEAAADADADDEASARTDAEPNASDRDAASALEFDADLESERRPGADADTDTNADDGTERRRSSARRDADESDRDPSAASSSSASPETTDRAADDGTGTDERREPDADSDSDSDSDAVAASRPGTFESDRHADRSRRSDPATRGRGDEFDPSELSTGMLLANVALSQGLFALVLLGAVLYTGIPADALGFEFSVAYLERGVVLGTAAGLVLYVGNEIGAATATRFGFDHNEQLRELLAPDSARGWAVLLLAVLPIIAVFEELLFRAALIGVVWTHYGVDPWLLAVGSSVAFAIGHGMQGSVGVVVTGALGFVLAAIFIVTESLLVVVVAHYLVNALEFAVHEGLKVDWAAPLEGSSSNPNASDGDGRG